MPKPGPPMIPKPGPPIIPTPARPAKCLRLLEAANADVAATAATSTNAVPTKS